MKITILLFALFYLQVVQKLNQGHMRLFGWQSQILIVDM